MRVLAHLSDIHFGAVDLGIAAAVRAHLERIRPDYTIISGDLTQRARFRQFRAARAYLDTLPGKQLVIPGNHDVPLWNVFARFLTPLWGYHHYITRDMAPAWYDHEVTIVGINTARSWTRKNGRINLAQVEHAAEQLRHAAPNSIRVVVTHHPLDLGETYGAKDLVGRASMAIGKLAAAGADVLLAGHLHEAYTGGTAHRYPINGYSALVVQAGTATSTRTRLSPNSFNILRIEPPRVSVEVMVWDPAARAFQLGESKHYERHPGVGFVRQESAES